MKILHKSCNSTKHVPQARRLSESRVRAGFQQLSTTTTMCIAVVERRAFVTRFPHLVLYGFKQHAVGSSNNCCRSTLLLLLWGMRLETTEIPATAAIGL